MSYLLIDNLTVAFKNFSLGSISLALPPGKVMAVLGPSGTGKSVLLETIAGFHRPQQGSICLEGREITGLPPEKRGIGFVFQDYALFPNKSVQQNISFPLQFRQEAKISGGGITVSRTMEMLHLTHLAGRYPATLSGGEKQRVALARALVCRPKLFLFDEPMSALDARARQSLQEDLRGLIRELGLTAVYVTHDQSEALALGDLVAVINNGRLLQCGSGNDVFNQPLNEFVARFVGMENLLAGRLNWAKGELAGVILPGNLLITARNNGRARAGEAVLAGIRPENISVHLSPPREDGYGASNIFKATVCHLYPAGFFYKMRTEKPFPLVAYLTGRDVKILGLERGKEVYLAVAAEDVHIMG